MKLAKHRQRIDVVHKKGLRFLRKFIKRRFLLNTQWNRRGKTELWPILEKYIHDSKYLSKFPEADKIDLIL